MRAFTSVIVAALALASFSGSNASKNTLPYTEPKLSGLVANTVVPNIKLPSVHYQADEFDGRKWMEICCGLTPQNGTYKSLVDQLLQHQTRKYDEQTIADIIEPANFALFNFLSNNLAYTNAQFQSEYRNILPVASLLKGKYVLHETLADTKHLIERVCIDFHIAICWMKAGISRTPRHRVVPLA
ncbi:uncharacterized protein LOC116349594 [Contarinia nasturtii]|uniref:uncharacterized protein LOC116349594 n=1 Tax=Contarinia nasturtii TaxID=265458 RepID=UPI0012D40091|nr:uncharacterized protein LOC116349594 [Contarinia nasturtii]